MKQIIVDIEIQGIAPLLQNNIESAEEQMLKKKKRSTGGVKNDCEEWKGKLYKVDDYLGHPGMAVESCLIKAGRDFKADKRRSMSEVIKATCFVNEPFLKLIGKKEPDCINRASVVNPHTRGRGFVYRPQFNAGWKAEFSLTIADLEIISIEQVKEILDHAGQRIGIGDWRPKFGRFFVSKFQIRK